MKEVIIMKTHDTHRLVQKYVILAILITKLAEEILKLLSMAFNYLTDSPDNASA